MIRAIPLIAGLILFWPGLTAWFQKDDFAWLGLLDMVTGWRGLGAALFQPLAQGTIRTLGERVPFIGLRAIFGLDPLPFRILSVLTFFAVLLLLQRVCARVTGSRAAGFWAAMLWLASGAVGVVMSWASPYHELLLAAVLLGAFDLFLTYEATGEARGYVAQWIVFLAGFLVMEQNVVYPAIVLAWAPRLYRRILPMFGASAVYTAIHLWAAPMPRTEPYVMHWDAGILGTLGTYWKMAMGPNQLIHFHIYPSPGRSALTILLTAGLLVFLAVDLKRGRSTAAFFAAWFLITLAPLLPLRNHVVEYYLVIPRLGLAMWGGWALINAWRSRVATRAVGVAVLAVALGVGIAVAWVNTKSFHDRAERIRLAVNGTVTAVGAEKDRTVLLRGVDNDLFWSAFYGRPLRFYGINNVYIDPADRAAIDAGQNPEQSAPYFLPPDAPAESMLVVDLAGILAHGPRRQ